MKSSDDGVWMTVPALWMGRGIGQSLAGPRRELDVDPGEIQNCGDLSDAVIDRNDIIETERIKELPLVSYLSRPIDLVTVPDRFTTTESRLSGSFRSASP